jgi:hypothetical protein
MVIEYPIISWKPNFNVPNPYEGITTEYAEEVAEQYVPTGEQPLSPVERAVVSGDVVEPEIVASAVESITAKSGNEYPNYYQPPVSSVDVKDVISDQYDPTSDLAAISANLDALKSAVSEFAENMDAPGNPISRSIANLSEPILKLIRPLVQGAKETVIRNIVATIDFIQLTVKAFLSGEPVSLVDITCAKHNITTEEGAEIIEILALDTGAIGNPKDAQLRNRFIIDKYGNKSKLIVHDLTEAISMERSRPDDAMRLADEEWIRVANSHTAQLALVGGALGYAGIEVLAPHSKEISLVLAGWFAGNIRANQLFDALERSLRGQDTPPLSINLPTNAEPETTKFVAPSNLEALNKQGFSQDDGSIVEYPGLDTTRWYSTGLGAGGGRVPSIQVGGKDPIPPSRTGGGGGSGRPANKPDVPAYCQEIIERGDEVIPTECQPLYDWLNKGIPFNEPKLDLRKSRTREVVKEVPNARVDPTIISRSRRS